MPVDGFQRGCCSTFFFSPPTDECAAQWTCVDHFNWSILFSGLNGFSEKGHFGCSPPIQNEIQMNLMSREDSLGLLFVAVFQSHDLGHFDTFLNGLQHFFGLTTKHLIVGWKRYLPIGSLFFCYYLAPNRLSAELCPC